MLSRTMKAERFSAESDSVALTPRRGPREPSWVSLTSVLTKRIGPEPDDARESSWHEYPARESNASQCFVLFQSRPLRTRGRHRRSWCGRLSTPACRENLKVRPERNGVSSDLIVLLSCPIRAGADPRRCPADCPGGPESRMNALPPAPPWGRPPRAGRSRGLRCRRQPAL